jgi:transcription initiation factor TFIIF subunit beta
MPRNELLDHLFAAYREQPRWTLKSLREKTAQPEVWLKENLSDIASLHRSGEFNGLWELKAMFKDANVQTSAMVPMREGGYTMEEDDGDEDDEDDDMEEVS